MPEQIYPPKLPPAHPPVEEDVLNFKRRPTVPFTFERQMRYLGEIRRHGQKTVAAARAGTTPGTVLTYRKNDPDFDAAITMAEDLYVEEVLLAEAQRRAVEGVTEPVIGGRNRDEVVCEKVVYSDSLLALLLKSRRSEFREGSKGDPSRFNQQGGVVVIPAGPSTPESWEENFAEAANPRK
jgi:hypothetical protein